MDKYGGLKLAVAALLVVLFYIGAGLLLSIPVVMGECLPRDDPMIALCDADKKREFATYLAVFLGNFVVAAWFGWRRSTRHALLYLAAASALPLLFVIAINLAETALGIGWH